MRAYSRRYRMKGTRASPKPSGDGMSCSVTKELCAIRFCFTRIRLRPSLILGKDVQSGIWLMEVCPMRENHR